MIDVNDEASVLEILHAAQISVDQLPERTSVNRRGRVVTLRLNPCISLHELPSCIGDLIQLEEIYLFWGGSNFVSLPSSIERLSKLKVLQLRWCLSLTSLPDSLGTRLKFLEDLTLEGCGSLENLSFLREAKFSWVNLKSLKIICCGNSNLTHVFDDDSVVKKNMDCVYFPSLQQLSLRRNSISGRDFSRLWPFFHKCPKLSTVDLSDNQIETLKIVAANCLVGQTGRISRGSLRHLNLAGNPVLNISTERNDSTTGIDAKLERVCLLRILKYHPQLESIVACCTHNERRSTTPTSAYECLATASLYSPQVQHILDMNRTSKGNFTHLLGQERAGTFPLSLWPLILERVAGSSCSSRNTGLIACRRCGGMDKGRLMRREASVVFSMLKGPAFASR